MVLTNEIEHYMQRGIIKDEVLITVSCPIFPSIFLIHVLKEQLGDLLFISFVIASGEAIIFYFE
jgi:hypothetical protein